MYYKITQNHLMKKVLFGVLALFLTTVFSVSLAQSVQSTSSNSGTSSCTILTTNLRYGSNDSSTKGSVTLLQKFLVASNYLTTQPTGFFGTLTRQAVTAFQKAEGINASPVGFVGSVTRAKIQTISCVSTNTTQSTTQASTVPSTVISSSATPVQNVQNTSVVTSSATPLNGDDYIYSADKSIEVVTSNYLAGAISALLWNGKQYIDDIGHGSSLQYAVSVDGLGGNYNPTEAGGEFDDYNLRQLDDTHTTDLALDQNTMVAPPWATTPQANLTSSILQQFAPSSQTITTQLKMAFWVIPTSAPETWTDSAGVVHDFPPSVNTVATSNYVLTKTVTIAPSNFSNVVKIDASVVVPPIDSQIKNALNNPLYGLVGTKDQTLPSISIEAPTGYLLKDFNTYYEVTNATATAVLVNVTANHGTASVNDPYKTQDPIIYSTADNNYALGVYSLPTNAGAPTYNTYTPGSAYTLNLSKWGVTYDAPLGNATSTLNFTTYLVVGKVADVEARLVSLITGKPIPNPAPATPAVPPLTVSCSSPSPSSVNTGASVAWTAMVSGGTAPYSYYWSDNSTGNTDTHSSINSTSNVETLSYATAGTKYMGLAVIDSKGQNTGWAFCPNVVTVTTAPTPVASTPSALSATCSLLTPSSAKTGSTTTWSATVSGGTAPYNYYWDDNSTGTDTHGPTSNLSDSDSRIYTTTGTKDMGFAVIDSKALNTGWAFCPETATITN